MAGFRPRDGATEGGAHPEARRGRGFLRNPMGRSLVHERDGATTQSEGSRVSMVRTTTLVLLLVPFLASAALAQGAKSDEEQVAEFVEGLAEGLDQDPVSVIPLLDRTIVFADGYHGDKRDHRPGNELLDFYETAIGLVEMARDGSGSFRLPERDEAEIHVVRDVAWVIVPMHLFGGEGDPALAPFRVLLLLGRSRDEWRVLFGGLSLTGEVTRMLPEAGAECAEVSETSLQAFTAGVEAALTQGEGIAPLGDRVWESASLSVPGDRGLTTRLWQRAVDEAPGFTYDAAQGLEATTFLSQALLVARGTLPGGTRARLVLVAVADREAPGGWWLTNVVCVRDAGGQR